jgi:nitroimidazol reductase NimA-like FMN-containing flavoprotein (pyridoxamine 5'-phosphate oxidase superfamily)
MHVPRPFTQQEREAFLAGSHIAVLSLPSDDARAPLTFPVWYGYEPGGEITYFTHRSQPPSRKFRLLATGTPVSLCVQREEVPYQYVTVEGAVVASIEAPTPEQMLAIVRRYLPADAAAAYVKAESALGASVVLFTIRPDRWSGIDFGEDAE